MKKRIYTREEICRGMIPSATQIGITGPSGCGKSSLIRELELILKPVGYHFESGGAITREFQRMRGFKYIGDYVNFLESVEVHPDDILIDEQLAKSALEHLKLVLEARLAHVWVTNGVKVFLDCPLDIRAQRAVGGETAGQKYDTAYAQLSRRDEKDVVRNERRNPGCIWKLEDFDLVLSSVNDSPRQLAEKVIAGQKAWFEQHALVNQ